jgi:carbamoyl-phosphate synthase large subunit
VRPSYVLGGRAMEIVYSTRPARLPRAHAARGRREIFLDRFLENAIEVDVDAICDGEDVWIGGIMQHVEEAGIHSGDSACVLPPHSLGHAMLDRSASGRAGSRSASASSACSTSSTRCSAASSTSSRPTRGASRTVPFVSKAIGFPLAKLALPRHARRALRDLDLPADPMRADHVSVKEAVLPFDRFEGSGRRARPEMRSTGEVMGVARDFPPRSPRRRRRRGARCPTAARRSSP